jgi:hypothetical protein
MPQLDVHVFLTIGVAIVIYYIIAKIFFNLFALEGLNAKNYGFVLKKIMIINNW